MVGIDDLRSSAVLLRDDSFGVATETTPRKIQDKDGQFMVSINQEWLDQLNIKEQSEPTLHSFSIGSSPVIVQNPAIIIQPAGVLESDD